MTIRKSNTKLTVDQIIDGAADVLEKHGWITGSCEDGNGGHCSIGAVAKCVYPKAGRFEIEALSYVDKDTETDRFGETVPNAYLNATDRHADPRHVEAINFLGKRFGFQPTKPSWETEYRTAMEAVLGVNDNHASYTDELRLVSSKRIVKRFRTAAEAYRRQQAKAATKAAA